MKDIIDIYVEKLNEATKYYDMGQPIMKDWEWDKMFRELQNMELTYPEFVRKDSPTQSIYFETVSELKKKKHNHSMLSLDKTKNVDDVRDFCGENEVVLMPKFDGLTCSLTYENGKLISAETRGDGEIGEDILHNVLVNPTIPKHINLKGTIVVDGEIVCDKNTFDKYFANEYKNPRNFATGSIRLLSAKESYLKRLSFVVWDMIFLNEEDFTVQNNLDETITLTTLVDCFELLQKENFNVTPYIIMKNDLIQDDFASMSEKFVKNFLYPYDGIVIKFNDLQKRKSMGRTAHHKKDALAFKFYDDLYSTELVNIDWSIGRTGILTPVAVFKPINIDGTEVSRASLHNIDVLVSTLGATPYLGEKIEVYKANAIIPQIVPVDKNIQNPPHLTSTVFAFPEVCPCCGEVTIIKKIDVANNIYCPNPNCSGKLINRLDHYCNTKKGMNIKGLSKARLEQLIEWDWVKDFTDIYNLKNFYNEWINKAGFGKKSVDNILNAIEESKKCSLSTFIAALGIPLIGKSVADLLVQNFPTWEQFRQAIENNYDFSSIDTIGYEINKQLISFNYEEADKIAKMLIFEQPTSAIKEIEDSLFEGLTFAITGKLKKYKNRQELEDFIKSNKGKITNSITKKVSYLINNDINSTSAKNKKAKEFQIPIITEEDLLKVSYHLD